MVLELEDTELEPFALDGGLVVPLIRMTTGGLPEVEVTVGEDEFVYDRSYPIKGHSAVLPKYLREQMAAANHEARCDHSAAEKLLPEFAP